MRTGDKIGNVAVGAHFAVRNLKHGRVYRKVESFGGIRKAHGSKNANDNENSTNMGKVINKGRKW